MFRVYRVQGLGFRVCVGVRGLGFRVRVWSLGRREGI